MEWWYWVKIIIPMNGYIDGTILLWVSGVPISYLPRNSIRFKGYLRWGGVRDLGFKQTKNLGRVFVDELKFFLVTVWKPETMRRISNNNICMRPITLYACMSENNYALNFNSFTFPSFVNTCWEISSPHERWVLHLCHIKSKTGYVKKNKLPDDGFV